MAQNETSLIAADGERYDWIELYNDSDQPVDLEGWALTDSEGELSKWQFPAVQLAPLRYLVVFASGKDSADGALHTNFRLDADGEYLALVDDQQQVVHQFAEFPKQFADVSFGLDPVELIQTYMTRATPGQQNISSHFSIVSNVSATHASGFFDDSFDVELSVDTQHAVIRYTLDGSAPKLTSGIQYQVPIRISKTTTLRTAAFYNGGSSERTTTLTYLFYDDILNQSDEAAIANGFPAAWGTREADYAMDQRIIGGRFVDAFQGKYASSIRDDLLAIPSVSIVTPNSSLFDPVEGIYANSFERGELWERSVAVELIDPSGAESGFRVDAGLRIQGGITRATSIKNSMRLIFRSEYGAAELDYPLFGSEGADRYNSLVLRAGSGEIERQLIRDTNLRESQRALGQVAPHGRYVQLYLNGMYWGLYEIVERPDEVFAANYFGGEPDEWDVINAPGFDEPPTKVVAGNFMAWETLVDMTQQMDAAEAEAVRTQIYYELQGRRPDGSNDPLLENYLDVDNYIDYLITQWYVRNTDWPIRNYYYARLRGAESTGFKFLAWDGDFTIGTQGPVLFSEPMAFGLEGANGPGQIFPGLYSSQAFRERFKQRMSLHLRPGGPLYVDPTQPIFDPNAPHLNVPASRYVEIARGIEQAIVGESARWGDAVLFGGNAVTLTRDEVWMPRIDETVASFFNTRHAEFIAMMQRNGLYDSELVAPPRADLVFSEINYHPADPSAAEQLIDPAVDADDFEFVELFNRGDSAVNLQDFAIHDGVDFRFPAVELAAGEHAVVVRNEAAFRIRYGETARVIGSFDRGRLANSGERVALTDAFGQLVASVAYDDEASGWPQQADGEGFTLELLDERRVAVDLLMRAESWRLSAQLGGSPGQHTPIAGDANLDGLFTTADLVLALTTNKYERGEAASWSEGDWNRDGVFDTRDLVAALVAGGFESLG